MKRFVVLLALLLIALPSAGWAQRIGQVPGQPSSSAPSAPMGPPADNGPQTFHMGDKVAAVVNDNIITTSDIGERMHLAMISSGLPDNEEIRQKLLPQILRGLIDEQLQLQEAKRLDISISSDEIDKAMKRISDDNHVPGGDIRAYLVAQGASPDALSEQIRAGLAWNKVIQRELRPRVEVGDDEVDAVIERMRANAGKEEFLVSEIFLAVDSPQDEEQVKQLADNLVQQLKSGANFAAVARQFSQGNGAATGGDIGWIQEGQLPNELNHAMVTMEPGQVAGPIRSTSGFHILGMREKRTIALGDPKEITVSLQQAFRAFPDNGDKAGVAQEATQIRSGVTSCTNLQGNLNSRFAGWKVQSLGDVKMGKAPSWIVDKVKDVPIGNAAEPLSTDKGALVLFVCGRTVPTEGVNKDEIMSTIGTEKLELQARRLLRDLKRSAYLDIRLQRS